MTTLQQPALVPDQAVHEQFLALLCQDELALHAEFDDLIARPGRPGPGANHPRQRGEPNRPAAPRP